MANNHKNKVDALNSLRPGAAWTLTGDALRWLDDSQTEPTAEEIDAEIIKLQAEYDAQDYARKRKKEYPTIQELVVALYDTDDKAAIDSKRAEIKLKYPK